MSAGGVNESNVGQAPVASGVGVMEPPVNPGVQPNQLTGLESAIDAAKQALGQPQNPVASSAETIPQSPLQSSTDEFKSVFGSGEDSAVQPVPDIASSTIATDTQPVAQLDPSINKVEDLLAKGPQVVDQVTSDVTTDQAAQVVDTSSVEEMPSEPEVKLPSDVQEFLDSALALANKYQVPQKDKVTS